MASGSSGRANSGSKGFDFGSDDILCPYEDYAEQDQSNGSHSDPVINANSSKDFRKSRMARSSVFPTTYSQPEDSFNQDVISIVEKSMKKHADNLMRFLEGISSRLSQLELYCYNLDKSIGEMRSDLVRDHGEADTKLKSLEKHLQEVHRSVQILRDKQELAETQKELAKLQLVQKESSTSGHSHSKEERASSPATDPQKTDDSSGSHNQQLALALPHQVIPQQQPAAPPSQPPPQNLTQQQSYYLPPTQLPNQPAPQHPQQAQYPTPDHQYRPPPPHLQDVSQVIPQPTHSQVSQTAPGQPFPQYQQQQQWSQQVPQQIQPPQQQPQMRPPPTSAYLSYSTSQPPNTNTPIQETLPSSMQMQVPFTSVPQPGSRADTYGYSGIGRTVPQQPPPQQIKGTFGTQAGDGYVSSGPQPTLPPGNTYMMYDGDGGRTHHPPQQPHFTQATYHPPNASLQNPQQTGGPNLMVRNSSHTQFVRNHPYSELIEKMVNMGFRSDHVASVIQRLEETGQLVDFNSVLDRLNVHSSSAGNQRGWSG